MNPWSIIASVAMLAGAGLLAWRHTAGDSAGEPDHAPGGEPDPAVPPGSPAGRIAVRILHFFGIGGLSLGLAGAVILGVAAVVCAALDIIAVLHFGRAYPSWFPANALLAGLIAGLGCARVVAAPRRTS
jgi:hypothetical protein